MNILVTGGAGFIGSHLCDSLLRDDHTVFCLDDFNNYYSPDQKISNIFNAQKRPSFKLIRGDIRNKKLVKRIFDENEIDKVVHLAARAGVRPSFENPELYEDVNVNGTKNLLDAALKNNVKQFIFASSSSVYGTNEKIPFSEEDEIQNMISPYAKTKRKGELLCKEYSSKGLKITILRFFTVFGPRNRPDMAVFKFSDSVYNDREIILFGDGSMKRDFTFVSDIVNGIKKSLEKEFEFEIINLGNNKPITVKELIELIEKTIGKKASTKSTAIPNGDVPITYADISKAKKLLGWEPETSVEEGLKQFSEWYLERYT